jgi:hypothetical protein
MAPTRNASSSALEPRRNTLNQRAARARRKDYIAEMERRIRTYESQGAKVTEQIQAAARRVAEENRDLKVQLQALQERNAGLEEALWESQTRSRDQDGISTTPFTVSAEAVPAPERGPNPPPSRHLSQRGGRHGSLADAKNPPKPMMAERHAHDPPSPPGRAVEALTTATPTRRRSTRTRKSKVPQATEGRRPSDELLEGHAAPSDPPSTVLSVAGMCCPPRPDGADTSGMPSSTFDGRSWYSLDETVGADGGDDFSGESSSTNLLSSSHEDHSPPSTRPEAPRRQSPNCIPVIQPNSTSCAQAAVIIASMRGISSTDNSTLAADILPELGCVVGPTTEDGDGSCRVGNAEGVCQCGVARCRAVEGRPQRCSYRQAEHCAVDNARLFGILDRERML